MSWFKSIPAKPAVSKQTTKAVGDEAEALAMAYLIAKGMVLVARNFKTPGRGGGEVDLIMRAPDGTLVFVEVRHRKTATHGGAAASVGALKQRRIVFAARHFISRLASVPPCRFDVICITGVGTSREVEWLPAAFDAT